MRNRFLMAGLLALGVAACGDDVEVISPAPPVVPPPPPVTATMVPASAEVAVGNIFVFSLTVTGGVAGEAASWTCTSSNTGIATAAATADGCAATGVAAGTVSINATVAKGSEAGIRAAAELTVTSEEVVGGPGTPAFVLLTPPTTNGDGNVSGTVTVLVSVDRGDQRLAQVRISVDGEIVDYQSFGGGMMMAPAEDEPAEQAAAVFTLSFDSDEYDETGVAKYMNGDHVLTAGILVEGSMEPILSNSIHVDFDNGDGVHVTASAPGEPVMNAATGALWYGGPGSNEFTIGVVPVIYSGGDTVSSVTLLGGFCGAKAATDSEAPFDFTLECKSSDDPLGDTPTFTLVSGGESNATPNILNESIFPIRLDYEGPEAPTFAATPNDRQDGWINGTVDLTGKHVAEEGAKQNLDGWLNYNDKDEDNPAADGVGGYTVQLRHSTTTPSIVDGAIEAAASSSPTLPAATKKATDICFIATAVDALGNESDLPDAGDSCKATDSQVTLAGVDITAPTIEFTASSPKDNSRDLDDFQVRVEDEKDGSGIHTTSPVSATVVRRDAKDKMICGDDGKGLPGDEDIYGECQADGTGFDTSSLPRVTTTGLSSPKLGYHTFTVTARDNAGNPSERISRVALHDTGKLFAFVGTTGTYADKKAQFPVTVTLTDDYSIRDYRLAMVFGEYVVGAITEVRTGAVIAVDDYNPLTPLTPTLTSPHTIKGFRALQLTTSSGRRQDLEDSPTDITFMKVSVRDQGAETEKWITHEEGSAPSTLPDGTAGFAGANPNDGNAVAKDADDGYGDEVIRAFDIFTFVADETSYDSDETIELTAEVKGIIPQITEAVVAVPGADPPVSAAAETATPGLLEVPFLRVDFYATSTDGQALQFITSLDGEDASEDVDEDTSADNDGDAEGTIDDARTFTYETEISAADFLAAVDAGSLEKADYGDDKIQGSTTDTRSIYAFGVRADGVAIISQGMAIVIDR